MMSNVEAQAIHDFWFGAPESDTFGKDREEWFKTSDAFDDACRLAMADHYGPAQSGLMDHWVGEVVSGVALCLVLDQYPRNAFRGTAKAFATDAKARLVSQNLIDGGLDEGMIKVQRAFVYMSFLHGEDQADQDHSVALFEELGDANNLDFAIRHRDIILRFGRFPHRNEILGRDSTAEEIEFLKQPNSSF